MPSFKEYLVQILDFLAFDVSGILLIIFPLTHLL